MIEHTNTSMWDRPIWWQRGHLEGKFLRMDRSWETLPETRWIKDRAERIVRKHPDYPNMIRNEFKDSVTWWVRGCKAGWRYQHKKLNTRKARQ